jgi:DNA-binding NtrC family response regulator
MKPQLVVAVSKQEQIVKLAGQIGCQVFAADDLAEAAHTLQSVRPEIILLDYRFGREEINHFLSDSDNNIANAVVIIVGDGSPEIDTPKNKLSNIKSCYYLSSPDDSDQLQNIIRKTFACKSAGDNHQKTSPNLFLDEMAASAGIVGQSKAIAETLKMIRLVALSNCNPVLIAGETGTGKELVARAVHNIRSPNENFIALNCAALTAALLESELFGHVKGSFTSADRDKTGLLELAGRGTIFLDEISEMPTDLQAKLLRVIQEKDFRKVGGTETIRCKATIIASSNRNLHHEVKAGRFRSDLFYRLSICPILIEPLCSPNRKADIPTLAQYFLQVSTLCPEKHNKITSITALAIEALQAHHWPGNARELRNVIERAILLETTDKIGMSNIIIDSNFWSNHQNSAELKDSAPPAYRNVTDLAAARVADLSLEKAERELIARALQQTGWQKTQAASLLGISRATLYAKLEQYNIEKDLAAKPLISTSPDKSEFAAVK